jgi:type IV pilus assembly protein PilO
MGARHADRLWIAAGAMVVALLAVATWFLAVSPQHADAAALRSDTETARAQADDLRARIVKLTADKASLSVLTKALNARKDALPADSGVPAFLRQLQATGTAVGVDVSGVTVGDPAPEEAVPEVWALPIQLTAEGTAERLGGFLQQLQGSDQKRAVLIQVADLSSFSEGPAAGTLTLNLTVKAFVAPPAGAGAPSITTD